MNFLAKSIGVQDSGLPAPGWDCHMFMCSCVHVLVAEKMEDERWNAQSTSGLEWKLRPRDSVSVLTARTLTAALASVAPLEAAMLSMLLFPEIIYASRLRIQQ